MSTVSMLRAATADSHRQLERRLDVKALFSSRPAYIAYLSRMWGFYAALEMAEGARFGTMLIDYETRRKLPTLTRDLIALGSDPSAVTSLPRCEALPNCADSAAAFGCLYVMEGSTLGGRTLLPLVEGRLNLTATHGATFLASYGDETKQMWRRFCSALDTSCVDGKRRKRAAAAAVSTFQSLEQWLCGMEVRTMRPLRPAASLRESDDHYDARGHNH